jgi:hypothetical protein
METVTSLTLHERRRSARHRGPGLVAVLATLVAVMALTAAPQPAQAAAFAIDTPAGSLFPGTATITGTKDAATTVSVGVQGQPAVCPDATGPDPEAWSCDVALPDGSYTITATEAAADGTPVGSPATVEIRVLGAPTITTTGLTSGTINGTGYPGAGIEISGAIDKSCGAVQSNGSWSCALGVGTGTYSITATQTWANLPSDAGGSTAPTTVRVDADPPAAPAFAAPAAGSRITVQPTTFSGSGENGGRVEVFVNSTRVCVSPVINGQWSCAAALADGQHSVQGIQWDAAGNASGASTAFTVTAAAPAPVTPAEPPRKPAPAPLPATPLQPLAPAPTAPFLPPPVGGESGMAPFDTWELPTNYGGAIPSISTTNPTSWLLGLGLGLGFALLVALPLRLLVTTFRRKRGYEPREQQKDEEEPLLGPRLTAALFLGAAVLLAALAGGVQAEARYLRLALAIGLALAALNGVSMLAAKLAGRVVAPGPWAWRTGIRLAPLMLGIAAVTAFVSRVAGIQPPIVVGVVLAVRFAPAMAERARGLVSLVELSAIVALGFAAWLAQSALGPVDGFLPSLASEALSALCIAALGSAMVMLLPVNRMPGRLIWTWSRPAWASVTLVTATVAGVVIAGGSGFPVPWVIGGALVFAAVSVGAWAWVHLVEPQFVVRGGS